MNIDERLEALTQTVELLAQMHKDNEQGMERFGREMERLSERNARLEGLVTEIAEGTARLLHVVETHEQRINNLEGNQPQ
jgi:chromosome segregation ATPase